jgi:hypothetical protein
MGTVNSNLFVTPLESLRTSVLDAPSMSRVIFESYYVCVILVSWNNGCLPLEESRLRELDIIIM